MTSAASGGRLSLHGGGGGGPAPRAGERAGVRRWVPIGRPHLSLPIRWEISEPAAIGRPPRCNNNMRQQWTAGNCCRWLLHRVFPTLRRSMELSGLGSRGRRMKVERLKNKHEIPKENPMAWVYFNGRFFLWQKVAYTMIFEETNYSKVFRSER